jgi:hypothetical protein
MMALTLTRAPGTITSKISTRSPPYFTVGYEVILCICICFSTPNPPLVFMARELIFMSFDHITGSNSSADAIKQTQGGALVRWSDDLKIKLFGKTDNLKHTSKSTKKLLIDDKIN